MQPHINMFNVVPTIPTVNSLVRVQVTIGCSRGWRMRRAHIRSCPRVPSTDHTRRSPQQPTSQGQFQRVPRVPDRRPNVSGPPWSDAPSIRSSFCSLRATTLAYIILTGRTSVASGHILTLRLVTHQGWALHCSVLTMSGSASGHWFSVTITSFTSLTPPPLLKCANHQVYHLVHVC
jgi:hypothetical protein